MEKDSMFQMRTEPGFLRRIDGWRRKQEPDIPSRSEAVRRLVAQALDAEEGVSQQAEAQPEKQ